MLRLGSFLRNPFSFLFAKTAKEERVAEYVIREHRNGRRVADILQDHYVQNRLNPRQQGGLLEREDLIRAVSRDDLEQARELLGGLTGES
jgi:hypothetical protein